LILITSLRRLSTAGVQLMLTCPAGHVACCRSQYASSKNWTVVIPVEAWAGGIAAAILIGACAGLLPAVRASRLPPTVALRTV
jgi:ABC-type antimicrobial peptide transport system permease subunit